jgi:hypothetical protein
MKEIVNPKLNNGWQCGLCSFRQMKREILPDDERNASLIVLQHIKREHSAAWKSGQWNMRGIKSRHV